MCLILKQTHRHDTPTTPPLVTSALFHRASLIIHPHPPNDDDVHAITIASHPLLCQHAPVHPSTATFHPPPAPATFPLPLPLTLASCIISHTQRRCCCLQYAAPSSPAWRMRALLLLFTAHVAALRTTSPRLNASCHSASNSIRRSFCSSTGLTILNRPA